MTENARHKQARALADGAATLLQDLPGSYSGGFTSDDLLPARELINMAMLLVDGKDEARAAKNAGDRLRRAKAREKPKKARPKKSKAWGAALTGGELDS